MSELNLITCIVQRGKGEVAVEIAMKAGAQGATWFYAKGTGIRQKLGILGNLIQPEKEVLLTVTRREHTDAVFTALVEKLDIKNPGQGFAFVHAVEKAVGFAEDKK